MKDFLWEDNIDKIRAEKITCPACSALGKYAKILDHLSKDVILLFTCPNMNCHVATFFAYLEDD